MIRILGAILEEVPKDDEASSMKFIGSTLITTAESREEVIEILKKDIYTTSGVWDIEKVRHSRRYSFFVLPIRVSTNCTTGSDLAGKQALDQFATSGQH